MHEQNMQTAIATVCLSGTLNEKLEAIAAARFKGVEIFEKRPAVVRRLAGGDRPGNQTPGSGGGDLSAVPRL
jgi:hypothetical protein